MSEDKDKKNRSPTLQPDWRDYIAIGIAALQTTLLPFILLLLVMLAFVLIVSKLALL